MNYCDRNHEEVRSREKFDELDLSLSPIFQNLLGDQPVKENTPKIVLHAILHSRFSGICTDANTGDDYLSYDRLVQQLSKFFASQPEDSNAVFTWTESSFLQMWWTDNSIAPMNKQAFK